MNTFVEMLLPVFYKWLNTMKVKKARWGSRQHYSTKNAAQWVKDCELAEWGTNGLFQEYLEMGKCSKC